MRLVSPLFVVSLVISVAAIASDYPNELSGLDVYSKYCSGLRPMASTVEDVRKVLGDQARKGDVLWYEKDEWKILVYTYPKDGRYPPWIAGKVKSIDFIPAERMSFNDRDFPAAFNSERVRGADASWTSHYDSCGLVYEVYTSKTPYGDEVPGDLNRISYRPPPHKVIEMQERQLRHFLDELKQSDKHAEPGVGADSR